MPDREELEEIVSGQLEEELFSKEDIELIRKLLAQDSGIEKARQLAKELTKGGDGK